MDRETTEQITNAAERLLGYERVTSGHAPGGATAAFRVSEKLRRVLSLLLGAGGFRALLTRALVLARAEAPWLLAVQVTPDGTMEGLGKPDSPSSDGRIAKGETALIAHLLGLLVTFVGETVMLRLVQEAWPKADLDDLYSDKGKTP